jgi:hypothetical protein
VSPREAAKRGLALHLESLGLFSKVMFRPPSPADLERRPYAAIRAAKLSITPCAPVYDQASFDGETIIAAVGGVEGELLVYVATKDNQAGTGDGQDQAEGIVDAVRRSCRPDLHGETAQGPHDLRVTVPEYGAGFRYSYRGEEDAPLELAARGICDVLMRFAVRGWDVERVATGPLQPKIDLTTDGETTPIEP